jgi:hypothetical protein
LAPLHHTWDAHSARHRRHSLLRRFQRFCERIVERDGNEIFERLDILGIHGFFFQPNALNALIARQLDGHGSAAGGSGHDGIGEFFLRLDHVGLHLFDLSHELHLFHRYRIRSSR